MCHSWLVSIFFDCPPGVPGLRCPNATNRALIDAAIRAGDIWWHALPFNAEMALYDRSMLAAAIRLTHDLDARFGEHDRLSASCLVGLRCSHRVGFAVFQAWLRREPSARGTSLEWTDRSSARCAGRTSRA